VRGVTIQVVEFDGRRSRCREWGIRDERFIDDNGNFHEAAIEAIAAIGVSTGCNATTRTATARGAGVTGPRWLRSSSARSATRRSRPGTGTFSDVPPGQWYTPYVERLAELGISVGYGDGTFRPHAGVSRAEMAVFMTGRSLHCRRCSRPACSRTYPTTAWYAGAAEGLRRRV
jgi:hypothetical protein